MFEVADVHQILEVFDAAGVEVRITGGWGVDALLGGQTRPHADLDLLAPLGDDPSIRAALQALGFAEVRGVPTNYVLRDAVGREVDVHLGAFEDGGTVVHVDEDGDKWIMPAGAFTVGTIGGRRVACLTADQQMRDHAFGYEPGPTDHADMRALHEQLGTAFLSPYNWATP